MSTDRNIVMVRAQPDDLEAVLVMFEDARA
jgi:hypothetical protein